MASMEVAAGDVLSRPLTFVPPSPGTATTGGESVHVEASTTLGDYV